MRRLAVATGVAVVLAAAGPAAAECLEVAAGTDVYSRPKKKKRYKVGRTTAAVSGVDLGRAPRGWVAVQLDREHPWMVITVFVRLGTTRVGTCSGVGALSASNVTLYYRNRGEAGWAESHPAEMVTKRKPRKKIKVRGEVLHCHRVAIADGLDLDLCATPAPPGLGWQLE